MKTNITMHSRYLRLLFFSLFISFFGFPGILQAQKPQPEAAVYTFETRSGAMGFELEISFYPGKYHNYPLMAIWVEDTEGNYLNTLYVAESIAKGVFRHGDNRSGKWLPGAIRRPAALPYWGHKRGIQAPDGYYLPWPEQALADAITGPTPPAAFKLKTHTGSLPARQFQVLLEINQSWDWNAYWTNSKFPSDPHYFSSSQPAVVYTALIDLDRTEEVFVMQAIGHSHWSGASGELFPDLSTLTTALEIAEKIVIRIKK